MKKLLLLMLLLAAMATHGQTRMSYVYDNAGNCILRTLAVSPVAELSDTPAEQTYTITFFPNPTKGNLTVRIEEFSPDSEASLILFDSNQQQILTRDIDSRDTGLDISDRQDGMYFLRITIDGTASTWKIIKQ